MVEEKFIFTVNTFVGKARVEALEANGVLVSPRRVMGRTRACVHPVRAMSVHPKRGANLNQKWIKNR